MWTVFWLFSISAGSALADGGKECTSGLTVPSRARGEFIIDCHVVLNFD